MKTVEVPEATLFWWRQLAMDNPADLPARIDAYILKCKEEELRAPSFNYQTKIYADGTSATGVAPLPDRSPTSD